MKIGVVAGAFDVIHPGYIKMFNECKKHRLFTRNRILIK